MKKSILVLLVFLAACANNQKNSSQEFTRVGELKIPKWIYAIDEKCKDKKYICASGEGQSFDEASLKAKQALAAFFESKIKTRTNLERHGLSNYEADKIAESIESEIEEKVEKILYGVKITNKFKSDDLHYALAVIERRPLLKVFYQEVSNIDSKLSELYQQSSRIYYKKLLALYEKRSALSKEISLLNGKVSDSPVSLEAIYELKNKSPERSIHIVDEGRGLPGLKNKVSEYLTSMGYTLDQQNYDYKLTLEYSTNSRHMNVKGFKKVITTVNLAAQDKDQKQVGALSFDQEGVGRSKKDALEKSKQEILQYIENNIDKLNI